MKTSHFTALGLVGWLALSAGLVRAHEARFFRILGPVSTTITGVTVEGQLRWTNVATNTTLTVQTASAVPQPTNWVDWVRVPASNAVTVQRVFDPNPPAGMTLIPAGLFTMGNPFTGEGDDYELPPHPVGVSGIYMDRDEVTKAKWDAVKGWSGGQGYSYDFGDSGQGKATHHPAHSLTWYDAVKWCNARSQQAGLVPCYYTDAGLTVVYKTGQVAPQVKWNANGYRLPTEAEWEKAARGGASGRRFPWNDADSITHSRANYYVFQQSGTNYYIYDISPTAGYHPAFDGGGEPYTSPVGYFAPNGYGLHDMAGNVWEWCSDWYDAYSSGAQTDPRGPGSGTYRVLRGGSWHYNAVLSRTACRNYYFPTYRGNYIGFRCVRLAQP